MTTITYDWDDVEDNIDEEYDGAGGTVADYTTLPSFHGEIIGQAVGGQIRVYHTDAFGSVTELSELNGTVTDSRRYTSFGESVASSGVSIWPFQFIGQHGYYYDAAMLVTIAPRRVYGTIIGRWYSHGRAPFSAGAEISDENWDEWRPLCDDPAVVVTPAGVFLPDTLYSYRPARADLPAKGRRKLESGVVSDVVYTDPGVDNTCDFRDHFPALKHCVITMKKDGNSTPVGESGPNAPGTVLLGACTEEEIIDFIRKNKCCNVTFLGHQGGPINVGGVVTDCGGGQLRVLPNARLEYKMRRAFRKNKCKNQVINIWACTGSSEPGKPQDVRLAETCRTIQVISNRTNCVCQRLIGGTYDPNGLENKCVRVKPIPDGDEFPPPPIPENGTRPPVIPER